MKSILISVVISVVLGGVLIAAFSGDHGRQGQADFALAATPAGPASNATALPTKTAAPASAGGGGGAAPNSGLPGQAIATKNGCTACHSTGGATGVGPTWKGLAGHDVPLADGSTAKADDAYLKESITSPNAKVVKGFAPGLMPATFGTSLKPEEIDQLVEFIKSLQ